MTWKLSLSQSRGRSRCRRAGQAGRGQAGGGVGGLGWALWAERWPRSSEGTAPVPWPPPLWQARRGLETALGPQGQHALVSTREMQRPGTRACSRVLPCAWLQPHVIRCIFNVVPLWMFFSGMEERGGGGIIYAEDEGFPGGASARHQVGYSCLLVSAPRPPRAPYPPRGGDQASTPRSGCTLTRMGDPPGLPGALSHSHLPMLPGRGFRWRGGGVGACLLLPLLRPLREGRVGWSLGVRERAGGQAECQEGHQSRGLKVGAPGKLTVCRPPTSKL